MNNDFETHRRIAELEGMRDNLLRRLDGAQARILEVENDSDTLRKIISKCPDCSRALAAKEAK